MIISISVSLVIMLVVVAILFIVVLVRCCYKSSASPFYKPMTSYGATGTLQGVGHLGNVASVQWSMKQLRQIWS